MGICLGSQLLAAALGARVFKGPRKEIGWYPVRLSPAALEDRLWSGTAHPFDALHWHGDVFELPAGAVSLASSELTAHQAYRYGPSAYGLLFHLEMTAPMIGAMAAEFGDELREAGGDAAQLTAQSPDRCARIASLAETVFSRWARLVNESRLGRVNAQSRP